MPKKNEGGENPGQVPRLMSPDEAHIVSWRREVQMGAMPLTHPTDAFRQDRHCEVVWRSAKSSDIKPSLYFWWTRCTLDPLHY